MSRSKQDTLLEERIEKIRKRNEEIERRHLEVEADKQNAAKLNALVQTSAPSEDWPIGGRSTQSEQGPNRPRRSETNRSQHSSTRSTGSAKCFSFGEGDGPPPDPKYRFLADSERDTIRHHSDRRPARGQRGRGVVRGAYTRDRNGGDLQRTYEDNKPLRPEYDAWKAERNRIDNDRINRQKTAEGHWRREWDNEKVAQDDDGRPAVRTPRGSSHRSNNWNDGNQYKTEVYSTSKENLGSRSPHLPERSGPHNISERDRLGSSSSKGNRGSLRGARLISSPALPGSMSKTAETVAHSERSVTSVGESIKVSVPNDSSTSVVKRVKVNAPIIGGTGRVGPRQKIRISYSSQSEDEAPQIRTVEIQANRIAITPNTSSVPNSLNQSLPSPSSKPPLPPSTLPKMDVPKPRRPRPKRTEHDPKQRKRESKREYNTMEESKLTEDKENGNLFDETVKENESGGDDSWEDITTTSGTESACEDISPLTPAHHDEDLSPTTNSNKLDEKNLNVEENNTVNSITLNVNPICSSPTHAETNISKSIHDEILTDSAEHSEIIECDSDLKSNSPSSEHLKTVTENEAVIFMESDSVENKNGNYSSDDRAIVENQEDALKNEAKEKDSEDVESTIGSSSVDIGPIQEC